MQSADWIRGVLHAFTWINARRNTAPHFEFTTISGVGSREDKLKQHLGEHSNNVEVFTSSLISEHEDELVQSLHGWLFVYLGFDNSRTDNDDVPRLVDPDQYFVMSHIDFRIVVCRNLARVILEVCKPTEIAKMHLQADDGFLRYSFGRHYILEGDSETWFLSLGEAF